MSLLTHNVKSPILTDVELRFNVVKNLLSMKKEIDGISYQTPLDIQVVVFEKVINDLDDTRNYLVDSSILRYANNYEVDKLAYSEEGYILSTFNDVLFETYEKLFSTKKLLTKYNKQENAEEWVERFVKLLQKYTVVLHAMGGVDDSLETILANKGYLVNSLLNYDAEGVKDSIGVDFSEFALEVNNPLLEGYVSLTNALINLKNITEGLNNDNSRFDNRVDISDFTVKVSTLEGNIPGNILLDMNYHLGIVASNVKLLTLFEKNLKQDEVLAYLLADKIDFLLYLHNTDNSKILYGEFLDTNFSGTLNRIMDTLESNLSLLELLKSQTTLDYSYLAVKKNSSEQGVKLLTLDSVLEGLSLLKGTSPDRNLSILLKFKLKDVLKSTDVNLSNNMKDVVLSLL